jgi:hypothetical protein
LQKTQNKSGKTNISIIADRKSINAGVDPSYQYIDKIMDDNVISVSEIEE